MNFHKKQYPLLIKEASLVDRQLSCLFPQVSKQVQKRVKSTEMRNLVRNVTSVCFLLLLTSFYVTGAFDNKFVPDVVWQLLRFNYTIIRQALLDTLASSSGASGSVLNSVGIAENMSAISARKSALGDNMCVHHTAAFLAALEDGQVWALQMLDAMGKAIPSMSSGDLLWTGDYGLCHRVVSNISALSLPPFSGKYCTARTPRKLPKVAFYTHDSRHSMCLGLCIPNTCSEDDITAIVNNMIARLSGNHVTMTFTVQCQSQSLDAKAIVAIAVCSVLLLCVVLGTTVDVIIVLRSTRHDDGHGDNEQTALLAHKKSAEQMRNEAGLSARVLLAFSVYTNLANCFSTRQAAGSLTCIHGIRFISMTWVVIGHTYLMPGADTSNNLLIDWELIYQEWLTQFATSSILGVDTFFVISGLLVAYLTLRKMKENDGKLNWFLYYFHRFWRVTPAYLMVMMVYVCLTPYWIEGPLGTPDISDRENCKSRWWLHLLYVQNLFAVNVGKRCMVHTWYLANDMQFYCIVSPLIILLLYKLPHCGIFSATSLIVASSVGNGLLTYRYKLSPTSLANVEGQTTESKDLSRYYYVQPYSRVSTYAVGLLAGYFLHVRECKLSLRWNVSVVVWLVATGSALALVLSMYDATNDHPLTVQEAAAYNALNQFVWAVCLGWVIIACVTGNGGFVNTFLSWSAFVPLSRLAYGMYLLHTMFSRLILYNRSTPFFLKRISLVNLYFADLATTLLAALVLFLVTEAPLTALEKIMFRRGEGRDETSPPPPLQDGGQGTKR